MLHEIILAAGVLAAPPAKAEPPDAALLHSLWTEAYCEGYAAARQQQRGKFDMLRQQMGEGDWVRRIEETLALPAQCPRKAE